MLKFIILSKYDTQLGDMIFSCALLQGQLQKQQMGYRPGRETVTGVGTVNNHWNGLLAIDSPKYRKMLFSCRTDAKLSLLAACSCSSKLANFTPSDSPWIEVYTVSKISN